MQILLIGAGVLLLATLLLAVLLRLSLWALRRKPQRFWWRTLLVHVVLAPVYLLMVMPGVLGWVGSRMVQTRSDERAYAGPRISADGTWVIQSRETLAAERKGEVEVAPALRASAQRYTVGFEASDGVALRAFLVPPRLDPRATVVLVHGLFRGALELEPVGATLRDLGAEVLLLELRNHGLSDRSLATFGLRESRDVVAAVAWLRQRPGARTLPLVLFGVSLGTAAVALASEQIEGLGGVILDAPMDDLTETAHRMLSLPGRAGGRALGFPQPFRWLLLRSIETWSGFTFADVRPGDVLRRLDSQVPVLLIGGGDDLRMPPTQVRALFDSLPAPDPRKQIWIRAGSGHGSVWKDDPDGYRRHLAAFLDLVAESR